MLWALWVQSKIVVGHAMPQKVHLLPLNSVLCSYRLTWMSLNNHDHFFTLKFHSWLNLIGSFSKRLISVCGSMPFPTVLMRILPQTSRLSLWLTFQGPGSFLHLLHAGDWSLRLKYWLSMRMYEENIRCPVCQGSADVYSDHQVGCGGNSHRIHWHDSIRNALFSVAQTAALAPRKVALSLISGTNSRPTAIDLQNWKTGQPVTLGVSVILTMQQRAINGGANSCGYALRLGEERKMMVDAEPCKGIFLSLSLWRL